jgi:hypothetical protein
MKLFTAERVSNLRFWVWKRLVFILLMFPLPPFGFILGSFKFYWSWVNDGGEWSECFYEGFCPREAAREIEYDHCHPSV